MRNILGLLLSCLVCVPSIAQRGGTTFYRTYQEPGKTTSLNSIQQTRDGGYIAIGSSLSSVYDLIVLRLDSAGRVYWQHNYVVPGQVSQAISIHETSSGYIALAALGPAGINQTLMVMRMDPTGVLLWQNTYPTSAGVIPYFIEPTTDGGYLVSAYQFSSAYSLWGLKLDSTGAIVWQKGFGTYAGLGSIHATADGGAIVAGGVQSGDTYAGRVLKLNAVGNREWDRYYTFPFDAFFTSVRPTPEGGFIVSGYYITVGTSSKALLIKLGLDGKVTATFAYGSSSCPSETAFGAQNLVGGGYLFSLGFCNGASDSVARIDASGAILWQRAPANVFEAAISPTLDGGYVAAGQAGTMLVVKANASGALPECLQNGTPDLVRVDPPPVVVTAVAGPIENTFTQPNPIAVTASPAHLTTQFTCNP